MFERFTDDVIVGFHQPGRKAQHHRAQHGERGQRHAGRRQTATAAPWERWSSAIALERGRRGPLDGVDELLVALCDIGQILSRAARRGWPRSNG